MNQCIWVLLLFVGIALLVIYIVYLCNLHSRVSRLERKASPRLEIIEREVHGIGFYMRILVGLAIFFCVCVSVHYLCFCQPKFLGGDAPHPDAEGTVVAIFGAIITLLVGWNIYSTVKATEELKSFRDIESSFRKELNKHKNDVAKESSELRKTAGDLYMNMYTDLLLTSPIYLSAHKEDFERLKEALDVYKSSNPKNLIANMLSKELSLGFLRLFNATPNEETRQDIILRIKNECDKEAISKLYAEYLSFSDETKAKHIGVNDIFLELLKGQP